MALPLPVCQAGPFFQPLLEAILMLELHMCCRVYYSGLPSSATTSVSARCIAISDDTPHCKIKLASEEQIHVTVLGPD